MCVCDLTKRPMKPLLLATCAAQLTGEGAPLAPDDLALLSALWRRGIRAKAFAWDDPCVEWEEASLVLIRSTWDYYQHFGEYLCWAEQVAAQRPLYPPIDVVRWNAHKSYLLSLSKLGIPIIPTRWVECGDPADLATIMVEQGWSRVVVKPAVGANASDVVEVDLERIAFGQAHFRKLVMRGAVLVQPHLATFSRLGERSLVWVAGEWSKAAICKRLWTRANARTPGDERIQAASAEEVQLARHVLACATAFLGLDEAALRFARVDLVPDEEGQLRLVELEMLEPKLYFDFFPHLAERLAAALRTDIGRIACDPFNGEREHAGSL
jgi:hypothetical protein